MCSEPLQLLPIERWGEMKQLAQADWPRSISILTLLETEEHIAKLGIDYGFKVFCPYGDMKNGIVALNVKNTLYEVIVLSPNDDTTELEKALLTTALIDWSQQIEIPYAPKNVADCMRRVLVQKNGKLYSVKTETYFLDKDSPLFDVSLPPDFSFKLLSLEHVDITNSTWPHIFPGSEWYFDFLIKVNLGYGLFKGDELVAWSFIKEMGALGHLYTLEKHRRKGYGELVLKLISNVLLKEKKHVYAFCISGNTKASNLYKKLKFASILNVEWLNHSNVVPC